MQLALNFRGELSKVSRYLVDELDQILAVINESWNEIHTNDDTLDDDVIEEKHIADGSISVSKLNFSPVGSDTIVATINASSEGLRIDAAKIQINGDVTFASGYDPTSKETPSGAQAKADAVQSAAETDATNKMNSRIPLGGAADDINTNTTTISGGKITTGSIVASKIAAHAIEAGLLATDLALTNKLRSSGATAFGTGTGFWLDATGSPVTFRVGDPSGAQISWDGSDLLIAGDVESDNWSLTNDGGLQFEPTSSESNVQRMIRWGAYGHIGCNDLRLWFWGPGNAHMNIYDTNIMWFNDPYTWAKLDNTGLRLYDPLGLFIDSGNFYFHPDTTDDTEDMEPLVYDDSDRKIRRKVNVANTGDLTINDNDGTTQHHFRFKSGILEDYWTD